MDGMLPVLLACSTLLVGCGQSDSSSPTDELPEWSATLDLQVGSIDDPDYALTAIRAVEIRSDGTMYTLHPQEQLIRMFAADGTLRGTIGGEGEGPGEFRNIGPLGWVADTLWVLDFDGYRFSQFSPAGDFLGSFTVPFRMDSDPGAPQPPRAEGLLYDGTVYGSIPAFSSQIADGTLTVSQQLLMSRDGRVRDTLPGVPFGRNQWAITPPDGRGGLYMPQPFADGPLWSFTPNERALVVLDRTAPMSPAEARFRLTKLTFAGDTVFSREYPFDPIQVTQEEVDSILQSFRERMGDRRFFNLGPAALTRLAEETLYRPAFRPPATSFRLSRDGTMWLRMTSGSEESNRWLILESNGDPVGRLSLPDDFNPLLIDLPYVWGFATDALDVPYLRRYVVSTAAAG